MEVVVKGAQDVLLTGNPDKSPFRHLYKRASPFALCDYKSYFINGNLTLFKRGDLLSKCYLMLEDFTGKTVVPVSWSVLFDTVDLYIGGQLIDSQDYTYSSFIWPSLESDNLSQGVATGTFYPLRFFFCNSWSSALPISGIKCHDVEFRITNPSPNYKFVLWHTFINLGDEERALIPSEIVITQVQRILTANKTNYSELIGPVKYLASFSSIRGAPQLSGQNSAQNLNTSSPVYFAIINSGAGNVSWSYSALPGGVTVASYSDNGITFSVASGSTISSAMNVVATNPVSSVSTGYFMVSSSPWTTNSINALPSIVPQTHALPTQAVDLNFSELPVWNSSHTLKYQSFRNIPLFSISGQTTNIIFGSLGGSFIGPVMSATGNFVQSSNCLTITTIDSSNFVYVTKDTPTDGGGTLTSITYSIPVTGVTITGSGTTATVTVPLYTNRQPQYGHYLNNGTYSGFVITVSGNSTYNQASGTSITVTSSTQFTYTTSDTIFDPIISVSGATITGSGTTATVTIPGGHSMSNGTYSGFVITVSGNSTYNQASGTPITVTSPTQFTYTTSGTIFDTISVSGATVTGSGTTATVTIPDGHSLSNGAYSGFVITVSGNSTYNQASGTSITVTSPTQFTYTTSGTISGAAPTVTSIQWVPTLVAAGIAKSVVSIVYTATGMTATPILTAAASVLSSPNPSYTSNLIVYASNYCQKEILVTFSSGHPFMLGTFSWQTYGQADYYGNRITEQNFAAIMDDYRTVIATDAGINDQLGYQRQQSDIYKTNIYVSSSVGNPYDQTTNPKTPGYVSPASGTFPNVMVGSDIYVSDGGTPNTGTYGYPIPSTTSGHNSCTSDFSQAIHELGHSIDFTSGPSGTYAPGVASDFQWWGETRPEVARSIYYRNKKFVRNPQLGLPLAGNGVGTVHMENYMMTWIDMFMGAYRHVCIYNAAISWTNSAFQEFLMSRIDTKILGIINQNPVSGQDPLDRITTLTGWTLAGLFAEWMYWMINMPSVITLYQYPGWGCALPNNHNSQNPEVNCFRRDNSQMRTITENRNNFVKKRWDQFGYFMPVSAVTSGSTTTLTPKFQYLDRCGFEVINISGNLPGGTSSYTVNFTPVLTNSSFSITGGTYSLSGGNIVIAGTTVSGSPLLGSTMNIASSYNNWGTAGGWAYLSNISGSTYTIAFGSGSALSSLTSGTVTSPIIFDTNLNGSSASDWIGVCCVLDATTGACIRSQSQSLIANAPSQVYLSSQIVVLGIACTNKIPIANGNMFVQFSVGISKN